MSWIQKLYETYDNCQSMVGYSTDKNKRPLLPIGHMTAQAHIEIVLNKEGDFQTARVVIDKNEATTIIPCTEGSGSRSGKKPECHPLCGQLQYVAGDFGKYGGSVTSGFAKHPKEPFKNYIKALTDWCEKFSHPKVQAVLKYVRKGALIKDLVGNKILFVGKNQEFLLKREMERKKDASDIFAVVSSQKDSFIRWVVEAPGENGETETWKDKTLWTSWIQYYSSTKKKEPLCYVTGGKECLSSNHPKYIRVKGDGAKLISANDKTDFTFRGRFSTAEQACGVSYEVSQKAHNALIWLISQQGQVFRVKGNGGKFEPALTVVAWATSGKPIPRLTDDSLAILEFDKLPNDQPIIISTAQDTAIKFRERMLGYASKLNNTDNVVVMGLDSATPGRMSITFYRELTGSDFLQRIENWHKTCEWIHEYRYKDIEDKQPGKKKRFFQPFIGAPAPINIAEAAYGSGVDDKLKKATVARIIPCIIDGQQIPRDLVESAVRRASNRAGMEEWEWNKTLSIACALYKKYHTEEDYNMALDENRKTRDYLYGRLLALADSLEQWALNEAGENRQTNAAKLMQRFADRPCSTWKSIELSLAPYKARLGGKSQKRQELIDKVACMFNADDFINDKGLSGEFLLGYHCQRQALKPPKTIGNLNEDGSEKEIETE